MRDAKAAVRAALEAVGATGPADPRIAPNLSDLAPGQLAYLLLFTHPTPPERIAAALGNRNSRT